ncbi:hypothetical protein FCM35_KLT13243 [Carex littledalei]|uniref:Glycine-rich protein n=1 Tax=Carex littledalei TaxID=544730 RepID=A0A833QII7_9POAL|nr:hypothetical protein FCM35_KLT13243 [Carex littledalei]
MKSSRKLLVLVLILAMMTCGFAMRTMATDQIDVVEKGKSKISSLGGTSIDNHHSIPRDQYNSHGGSTGDNGDNGSGSGGTG